MVCGEIFYQQHQFFFIHFTFFIWFNIIEWIFHTVIMVTTMLLMWSTVGFCRCKQSTTIWLRAVWAWVPSCMAAPSRHSDCGPSWEKQSRYAQVSWKSGLSDAPANSSPCLCLFCQQCCVTQRISIHIQCLSVQMLRYVIRNHSFFHTLDNTSHHLEFYSI